MGLLPESIPPTGQCWLVPRELASRRPAALPEPPWYSDRADTGRYAALSVRRRALRGIGIRERPRAFVEHGRRTVLLLDVFNLRRAPCSAHRGVVDGCHLSGEHRLGGGTPWPCSCIMAVALARAVGLRPLNLPSVFARAMYCGGGVPF